jgi:hypothetical protein
VVVAESVQNAFVFECLIRSASGQRPAFLERFQRRVAAADEPLLREMIVVVGRAPIPLGSATLAEVEQTDGGFRHRCTKRNPASSKLKRLSFACFPGRPTWG